MSPTNSSSMASSAPNELMLQAFEWNTPADHKHWKRLTESLPKLQELGVTMLWIPPGCKAMDPAGNGYDSYDFYDLGEFDQKGTVPTKWGPKQDLQELAKKANMMGIKILWDAVINHKAGGDHTEKCLAKRVDPDNRLRELDQEPREIEAWLGFDFPGRKGMHSSMKYHWQQFNGTDHIVTEKGTEVGDIYLLGDKTWADDVCKEKGNCDFLMFVNIDFSNKEVRADIKNWVEWLASEVNIGGIRLDAVKHCSRAFLEELLDHISEKFQNPSWFNVGEYWEGDVTELLEFLSLMKDKMHLFDVPLVNNFAAASKEKEADLRQVFKNTLVAERPDRAVTFVANHDTQPGQVIDARVQRWFKPLAYAFILLRQDGLPCLFYGDMYGLEATSKTDSEAPIPDLKSLATARKLYAHGRQDDYFDKKNCIGFVRLGCEPRPNGLACVMSNAGRTQMSMFVGQEHAGETWTEVCGKYGKSVEIDGRGYGMFGVGEKSVSVWVNSEAEERKASFFGAFWSQICQFFRRRDLKKD